MTTAKKRYWNFHQHMMMTNKKTWVTAKGESVLVNEMEARHLVATVNFLRRRAPVAKIIELGFLLRGPRPSGDQASLCFNDALEESANESLDEFLIRTCPPFKAMLVRYPKCKRKVDNEACQRESELLGDPDPWGDS